MKGISPKMYLLSAAAGSSGHLSVLLIFTIGGCAQGNEETQRTDSASESETGADMSSDTEAAALDIPTIGIGAGPKCDGQVLVSHDMLGLFEKFKPKFVRRYAEMGKTMIGSFAHYIDDVKSGNFPNDDESY